MSAIREKWTVKVPEQVARLGLVLGVLLAIIIPLRFFILPYAWFHYQPHQEAKVEREKLKPMHYAGALTCTKCHADFRQDIVTGPEFAVATGTPPPTHPAAPATP